MGWGGGGGRSVYSCHTHLYIWGLAGGGGWGGMVWEASLHEEYFQYIYVYKLQGRRATCLFFVEGLNNVYSCFPVYG